MKRSFINELMALPLKEMPQVMKKIDMLVQDPRPDGHVKKQLKHIDPRLHRIRYGDYRVFYTFEYPFISLLALRRRQKDLYERGQDVEFLGGLDSDISISEDLPSDTQEYERKGQSLAPADPIEQLLPRPITSEMLNRLRIPAQYHAALLLVQTGDELLDCPDVPDYLLARLLEHLFPHRMTPITSPLPDVSEDQAEPMRELLPKPITSEMLHNLRIPAQYHAALLGVRTGDELLGCSSVPSHFLTQLFEYQYPRSVQELMQEPDWVLNEVNDLSRFKEGELLDFLLKLSTEQEKYVQWALHAHGPTLLKGGPGTGKSTIALYRVHALVQELRQQGREDFRILFATYTDALKRSSEQLLHQLLGPDICSVDVKTTDALAISLLEGVNVVLRPASEGDIKHCLQQALKMARFGGNSQQQRAQRQAIDWLSQDYLEQEINQVIIARQLASVQAYLSAARPGRKVPLNATQRMAVWSVYEAYREVLEVCKCVTWPQLRVLAEQCVAQGRISQRYDAVIIDEAQDLDVSALRMLIQLCISPHRLFITADANQAIYGSSFSWKDVHATLRLQGRTAVLRTNYRSTRQIGEAARSYLGDKGLEQEVDEPSYAHNGARPLVRSVSTGADEMELLKRFLTTSARELRFSPGSCAILCPNKPTGQKIAQRLTHMGLQATFMSPTEVDLERPGIKVMLLRSAKGLEFPIVAIAGFLGADSYTAGDSNDTDGQDADRQRERDEALARDRRSIYVGMTRAMRALLVLVPDNTRFPLLTGFNPVYWDVA
jgi:superfamily I DNA/RNA helicase/mRNA-degrading endonuclease RelE of RelBE toxin-antitoxin system